MNSWQKKKKKTTLLESKLQNKKFEGNKFLFQK